MTNSFSAKTSKTLLPIAVFSGSSFGPFYSASIIIDTDTIIRDNDSGYNNNIGFTFIPYYNSTTVLPSLGSKVAFQKLSISDRFLLISTLW